MAGFRTLLAGNRRELDELDARTMRRFLKTFETARKDLDRKLAGIAAEKEWSSSNLLFARDQIEDAIGHLGERLGHTLARGAGGSVRLGAKHLGDRWTEASRIFGGLPPSPINIPVMKVVDELENMLLMRFEASRMSYSEQVISRLSSVLQRSFLLRETPLEAVKAIMKPAGIMKEEQWRAARIIRTETANAYEMAGWHSGRVAILNGDLPAGTQKRLVSHFDNRTARDSYSPRQHGQVQDWDKEFEDPVTGRTYMHPPNRPNDRATMIPWNKGWSEDALLEKRSPPPA